MTNKKQKKNLVSVYKYAELVMVTPRTIYNRIDDKSIMPEFTQSGCRIDLNKYPIKEFVAKPAGRPKF